MTGNTYQQDLLLSLNEKLIDSANMFFRNLVIINGGLCVTALGFASSLKGKQELDELVAGLSDAVFTGAIGVALAAAAIFLAYFTNSILGKIYIAPENNKNEKLHSALFWLTTAASIGSLGCFLLACWGIKVALSA